MSDRTQTPTIAGVTPAQTPRTRARDSDRTDTCQVLDTALAEGQLSMVEHAARVKSATNATTLGELRDLLADLQTGQAQVALPTLREPGAGRWLWGRRLAAVGVAVLLGVGIGWALSGTDGSPLRSAPDPGAQPDGVGAVVLTPPRQLHSLGGLNGLFEQMRAKFGDTLGFRLVVYPEYAVLDRPDSDNPRRELSYTYRGGWGDPSSGARAADAVAVDLAGFDTTAIVGILRGAPETLGINPAEVENTYLIVDPAADPTTPGRVSVSVYLSSDYGGGYIEVGPDGSVKRINYP